MNIKKHFAGLAMLFTLFSVLTGTLNAQTDIDFWTKCYSKKYDKVLNLYLNSKGGQLILRDDDRNVLMNLKSDEFSADYKFVPRKSLWIQARGTGGEDFGFFESIAVEPYYFDSEIVGYQYDLVGGNGKYISANSSNPLRCKIFAYQGDLLKH